MQKNVKKAPKCPILHVQDKNFQIFNVYTKHLQQSESCRNLCLANCFSIIDYATTSFQLKIKESLRIHWEEPTLYSQVKHVNLKLYVQFSHNHAFFVVVILSYIFIYNSNHYYV